MKPTALWKDYCGALAVSCGCTAVAYPLYPRFDLVNIIMLYLLGTTLGALRYGRGPCVLLAVINELAFDFFFVPPAFSLEVSDARYLFTMAVMLIVALVIAHLMVNVSRHRDLADSRERRTAVLYALSRELAAASDAATMAAAAVRHLCAEFHCGAAVLAEDEHGRLAPIAAAGLQGAESPGAMDPALLRSLNLEFAAEVAAHGERAIREIIYQPLRVGDRSDGVIALRPTSPAPLLSSEQFGLLDAFAVQLASALRRAQLAEAEKTARISEERALLRNTLLASISHDLRTPLSGIAAAGSLIAQPEYTFDRDRRMTLGGLIERKARDMSQQLENILALMQMEHGGAALNADWHAVEDLVEHSLRAHQAGLAQWRVVVALPSDLPLVLVEATLVVKILCNLLENATKYTQPGTTIAISAMALDEGISLIVEDDGPGLPAGDPECLFEKFRRGRIESNIVGVGLGLAICRAAARLHGGDIRATSRANGGAHFKITLPVKIQRNALPAGDAELLKVRA
jgi:two-component system sensor histidine kinase KdpD